MKLATIIAIRAALLPDGGIAVEVMRAEDAPPELLREGICALVRGLEELVPTMLSPGIGEGAPPMN